MNLLPPIPAALLNPGLLALGGALVAVPIIIHLLNRRRVQRMDWAAMQWLLAAMRRHQRRLRIENWLILLLRALAVLLLGLALARPVLTDPDLAGLVGGRRSVYLVVDNSYSMAAAAEGRPVLDVAKAEADAVLSALGGDDPLAVLVTNDPRVEAADGRLPRALLPRTVGSDGATRGKEAVAALRTRDAPANWAETLRLLVEETLPEDENRLVVLVTDLQARDWREGDVFQALEEVLQLPAAVRVIDVGGTERRNLTVADVRPATRRDAFAGRPWRVEVEVENQGEAPVTGARLSVALDGNATPLRAEVLPPLDGADAQTGNPGTATVALDLPPGSLGGAGSHVLTASVVPPPDDTGADALGLDSNRSFALDVRDRIRVLAWTRSSRNARLSAETYLRGVYERWEVDEQGERMRERTPLYELQTVATENGLADALERRGRAGADLVVLANVVPRGRSVDALRSWVRAGGALLVFVGDEVLDPAALNDPFFTDPTTRLLPFPLAAAEVRQPTVDETPFTIDLETDTGHPLAAPFTGEDARSWIGLVPPAIWGRMPFREEAPTPSDGDTGRTEPGEDEEAAQVVLRFADGRPAAVEGGLGLGRTLWVGTSLDHGWFERALPFFLPVFLDEAALWLTRPDEARRNVEVGRPIVVTWLPRDAQGARFVAPGGGEMTPKRYEGLGETERPVLVQDRVGTAGTWRLLYERPGAGPLPGEAAAAEEVFAVSPAPGEGRLRRAPDDEILGALPAEANVKILSSWEDVREDGQEIEQGEVSSLVLWIAILLLAAESVLAWAFGRRSRQAASAATSPAPGGAA